MYLLGWGEVFLNSDQHPRQGQQLSSLVFLVQAEAGGAPTVQDVHMCYAPCTGPHQSPLRKARHLTDSCTGINNCSYSPCNRLEQSLVTEVCDSHPRSWLQPYYKLNQVKQNTAMQWDSQFPYSQQIASLIEHNRCYTF